MQILREIFLAQHFCRFSFTVVLFFIRLIFGGTNSSILQPYLMFTEDDHLARLCRQIADLSVVGGSLRKGGNIS